MIYSVIVMASLGVWLLTILLIDFVIVRKAKREAKEKLDNIKVLLEDAERQSLTQYVKYRHIDTFSVEFIKGIQVVTNNEYVKSWLQQHKAQCNDYAVQALAGGDRVKMQLYIAQIAFIDSLVTDLSLFESRYVALLEREKGKNELS